MELSSTEKAMEREMTVPNGMQSKCENNERTQESVPSMNSSHPSHLLSSLVPCNMFFAGYLDCAQEALRYLLEIEKLPSDHPLVVGIQRKLYDCYSLLQMQYLFGNYLNVDPSGVHNVGSEADGVVDSFEGSRECSDGCQDCQNGNSEIKCSTIDTPSMNSGLNTDVDLNANGHKIAVALAEELYALMNPEESDSDVEELEGDVDEGFEEVTEAV